MNSPAFVEVDVQRVDASGVDPRRDQLAVEEPLEIRLAFGPIGKRQEQSHSVTMRTPGHDAELAAGFLLSEGIVACQRDIETIRHENGLRVELRPDVAIDLDRLKRHVYTTSSCGVCGKASIEALQFTAAHLPPASQFQIPVRAIHRLPALLRDSQHVFERTGGLHAAALFDVAGAILAVREDVGRHNAVDKLIGSQLLVGRLPLADRGMFVSGRASFELVQKALVAGIPLLAAVGAPSSLAVQVAKEYGMTLVGFVRDERFNVYSGSDRIELAMPDSAERSAGTVV